MGRRAFLKGAATLAGPALGMARLRTSAAAPPLSAPISAVGARHAVPNPVATPVPGALTGYAFNAKTLDVTLFDPVTRQVLATKPLGAVVRWLSNEQRYWDGHYIWTYDFPEDRVQAIAVDPRAVTVARSLPTGGTGPAHSLMLTADRKTAWVNVAGGNYLAVLDLETGEIVDEIRTGKFP